MEEEKLLTFAGHRLWCLAGPDLSEAVNALIAGTVDGIFISRHRGYALTDLTCLSAVEGLKILAIDDLEGIDLSPLTTLEELKFLSIGDVDGPLDLSGFRNLTHLRMREDKGRTLPVAGLPVLKELAIWRFSGSNLAILENYQVVEKIEIIQARKLTALKGLETCGYLQSAVIAYCPILQDIGALSALTGLHILDFENTKKIADWLPLASLKSLERLIIDKAAPLHSIRFISSLHALKHVTIRSTPILDNDLSPLLSLPHLEHVYLDEKREYGTLLGALKKAVAEKHA